MAHWMSEYGSILVIDQDSVKESFVLRNKFKSAKFIISTPILLKNRIHSINKKDLEKVHLVIIDEIDTFAVLDWPNVRFHKKMGAILKRLLLTDRMYMGLTASKFITSEREFWNELVSMKLISATASDMVPYLPYSRIIPVSVEPDAQTALTDHLFTQILRACYRCIDELGIPPSTPGFFKIVKKIASDKDTDLKQIKSNIQPYPQALRTLCIAIQATQNSKVALFEDTIKESYLKSIAGSLSKHLLELPTGTVKNRTRREIVFVLRELRDFIDGFLAIKPTAKERVVNQILKIRRKEKGLVFCRFIELGETLFLQNNSNQNSLLIHGELNAKDMMKRMSAFRWKSSASIAFMTRDLGGRGLDFPTADYMVLYSPKSNFRVVDQEICRIRSNRTKIKPIYLMFYSGTTEEAKAMRLLDKMADFQTLGNNNVYSVDNSSSIKFLDSV